MSFDRFFARIESPALRAIAAHWRAAASGRRMPGWKDIDPTAIAPHLPLVWSWKYDRAADRFVGRLAGEAITAVFGRQLRGASLDDFFAGHDPDRVAERFRSVVSGPTLIHGQGEVFHHFGRVGTGERIILPLAEDGEHVDGIFGATTYVLPATLGHVPTRRERIQPRYEFFDLEEAPALSA